MENDIPKISVIVPVYNVEKYLDRVHTVDIESDIKGTGNHIGG